MIPPVLELPKALAKSPNIPGRVAEAAPYDLGVAICQSALRDLPYRVGDSASFVENQNNAFALVVQAGKGLCVALRPGHHVNPPGSLKLLS